MIIESTKPVDEWTVDDWRDAFNTLTELYARAEKRAADYKSRMEVQRLRGGEAITTIMNLYDMDLNENIAELQRQIDTLTAERDRLRVVVVALTRQSAALRGGEGE